MNAEQRLAVLEFWNAKAAYPPAVDLGFTEGEVAWGRYRDAAYQCRELDARIDGRIPTMEELAEVPLLPGVTAEEAAEGLRRYGQVDIRNAPDQDKPKGPTRRYRLELTIGADTERDLLQALQQFVDNFCDEPPTGNGAMGGSTSGWSYTVKHDPYMTHKKYHEELTAYLEAKRAAKE